MIFINKLGHAYRNATENPAMFITIFIKFRLTTAWSIERSWFWRKLFANAWFICIKWNACQ